MSHLIHTMIGICVIIRIVAPPQSSSVDCYSDAVPIGAVARGGTVRVRQPNEISAVAFSPTKPILASTRYCSWDDSIPNLIYLWALPTGKCLSELRGHAKGIVSLCYSSGGRLLASASQDKTVCIWNTETGELTDKLTFRETPSDIMFSPDDTLLVIATTRVEFWDVKTKEIVRVIDDPQESVEVPWLFPRMANTLRLSSTGLIGNRPSKLANKGCR